MTDMYGLTAAPNSTSSVRPWMRSGQLSEQLGLIERTLMETKTHHLTGHIILEPSWIPPCALAPKSWIGGP